MHTPTRGGIVLLAVLTSTLIFPLAITGTSVALPAIRADLGSGPGALQWVVNSYNTAFAACLVCAGAVADAVGRRRVYTFGLALFGAGALGLLLAPNTAVLIALRTLSGAGAAAAVAGGTALLAGTFSGAARTRAFALLGTMIGAGSAFGPTVAGFLVEGLGWRAALLMPGGVALLVLCLVPALPVLRGDGRPVDRLGGVLFTSALVLLIVLLSQGASLGTGPLVAMAAAVALLAAAFAVVERRVANPLVDVALLTNRRFVAFAFAAAVFMSVLIPLLVYLPSYLISVVGLGAGQAGMWLLMMTVPTLLLPTVGAALAARLPGLAVVVCALVLLGTGAWSLLALGPDVTAWQVLVPFLLVGIGAGLTNGLVDGLGMDSVPDGQMGTAAGVFNTARLTLETISLAVVGAALTALAGGSLEGAAFTGAFHTVAVALGVLAFGAAVLVALLGRDRVRESVDVAA